MCAHYQLWSPPLLAVVPNHWTWRHSWKTQEPLQLRQTPVTLTRTALLSIPRTQWPEFKSHYASSATLPPHTSHLASCNPRPRATRCTSVSTRAGKSLSYWNHFIKSESGDCFSKWAEIYTKLQGPGRIRETLTPPKECCKPSVTGHKEIEIKELPDK